MSVQEALNNLDPQTVVDFQGQKINELQAENIVLKSQLESVIKYAAQLEQIVESGKPEDSTEAQDCDIKGPEVSE